jgi:MFS family permease
MFPIAFGIIRDTFTQEKLAVAQGIFSSMFSAGAVIGVVVWGTIIKNFGWHATFLVVIPIAIALLAIISKFIYVKVDQVISTTVSDKNVEFCCRFIHVRKDILLSDNSSSTSNINKNKSTIDIMGAITLSVTIISFLVALQFTQTINSAADNVLPTVIVFGVAAIISLLFFVRTGKNQLCH